MASNRLSAKELEELKKYYQQIEALTYAAADAEVQRVQAIGQARQELDRLRKEYIELTSDIGASLTAFQRIVQEISNQNIGLNDSVKAYKNLTSIAEKIQYHQKGISELSVKEIVNLKTKIELEKQRLENAQELLRDDEASLTAKQNQLQQQLATQIRIINALRAQGQLTHDEIKVRRDIERQLEKNYDQLVKTQQALSENEATINGQNIAYKDLVTTAEELNNQLSFTAKLVGKLENQFPVIGKALGGVTESFLKWGEGVFIIKKIIEGFNSLDKAQVEFGRTTGKNIAHMDTLNMSLISSADYIKTANELSKQLGANADAIFTKETLQEAAEMVNLMGMSSEDAGKMARFTRISGVDLKASNIAVSKQLESFNKTNRTGISLSSTLKDVANTSDDIALSLGGNPTKIALANSEARKLGLSLSQVDKIASSLLNFEDSISAELEAELLTGKQINLEQARLYALNNDIVGLTREIGTNQDLINSFAGSNRIQQEAIAKSLGLGREEMAKMIYDQRAINGLSDEQLQKVMGVSSEDLKRLSVQDSINKSIEKMTEALAGPLEALTQLLFTGERLKIVFGLISGIIAGRMVGGLITSAAAMAGQVLSMRAYNNAMNQSLGKEAALTAMKVAGAEAVSFGAVTAAIVGGLAAVGLATAAFVSMNKTPGLVNGGTVLGKGSVLVGEKGPEVLSLEPGATVTPLNKINAAKERTPDMNAFNVFLDKIVDRVSEGMSRANITTSVKVGNREIAEAANTGNLTAGVKTQ